MPISGQTNTGLKRGANNGGPGIGCVESHICQQVGIKFRQIGGSRWGNEVFEYCYQFHGINPFSKYVECELAACVFEQATLLTNMYDGLCISTNAIITLQICDGGIAVC